MYYMLLINLGINNLPRKTTWKKRSVANTSYLPRNSRKTKCESRNVCARRAGSRKDAA